MPQCSLVFKCCNVLMMTL